MGWLKTVQMIHQYFSSVLCRSFSKMDRLLTLARSRSIAFLTSKRSLSSFKPNTFDFQSRALLHLINQNDASKTKISPIAIPNTDLNYEHNPLFPLPGRIGLAPHTNISKNKSHLSKKIHQNPNLEIRSYDCSNSLRKDLQSLFLKYDTINQPLTAITIVFKTKSDMSKWSIDLENERRELTRQFIKLAGQISNHLTKNQYWVDFIDPSNGKPYYGPTTNDALYETDERLRNFGMDIVDLGCCRIIEHLQHGKSKFDRYFNV